MTGEEVEETEIPGFHADQQTFYTGNVPGSDFAIQVTPSGVRVISAETMLLLK